MLSCSSTLTQPRTKAINQHCQDGKRPKDPSERMQVRGVGDAAFHEGSQGTSQTTSRARNGRGTVKGARPSRDAGPGKYPITHHSGGEDSKLPPAQDPSGSGPSPKYRARRGMTRHGRRPAGQQREFCLVSYSDRIRSGDLGWLGNRRAGSSRWVAGKYRPRGCGPGTRSYLFKVPPLFPVGHCIAEGLLFEPGVVDIEIDHGVPKDLPGETRGGEEIGGVAQT